VTAPAPSPRRFPWAVYWALFGLIFVLGNLPVLTTVVAAAVANAYSCNISESVLNPCIINGTDWGSDLQFGGMSFLYLFLTWPVAFVLFVIWGIVLIVHRVNFKRRNPA
jgi:hypothetical protein